MTKSKDKIKNILVLLKIKKPRLKVKPPKVEISKKAYNRKRKDKNENY
jgi:hypothetical protein